MGKKVHNPPPIGKKPKLTPPPPLKHTIQEVEIKLEDSGFEEELEKLRQEIYEKDKIIETQEEKIATLYKLLKDVDKLIDYLIDSVERSAIRKYRVSLEKMKENIKAFTCPR